MNKHQILRLDIYTGLTNLVGRFRVKNVAHAVRLANEIAESHLITPDIVDNSFDLVEFIDDEWVSWVSEQGEDFDEVRNA